MQHDDPLKIEVPNFTLQSAIITRKYLCSYPKFLLFLVSHYYYVFHFIILYPITKEMAKWLLVKWVTVF